LRESTRDRARGMWKSILPALGVPAKLLNGKHQPCPFCGGEDRFRFADYDKGWFICNKCTGGSGFDLLMRLNGWDFKTAAAEVDKVIGGSDTSAAATTTDTDPRPAMRALWQSSQPITSEDVAGKYLRSRCALAEYPPSLRFVPRLLHRETSAMYPGMLALFTSADGQPGHLHKTYLDPSGGKAQVSAPRMFARGKIVPGGAVRLAVPDRILGIAEGIETTLSAQTVTGIPCWAALNASLLTKWQPPEGLQHVVVFGDNDANFAGQRAAFELARRLQSDRLQVSVCIPGAYKDWNDVHVAVQCGSSAAQAEVAKAIESVNPKLVELARAGGCPRK